MDFKAKLAQERIVDLTARGLWLNRLFCDALDEAAAATPGAIAIVDHNSMSGASTRLTYAELKRLSDSKGERVAVWIITTGHPKTLTDSSRKFRRSSLRG
jgi:cyclohexanecarboxylate-CoA ligase